MRFLFGLQLLLGLLMILMGVVVAARPYALLDVVLTPAELKDEARHDATLALLKKAVGRDHLVWMGGGAAVAIMGLLGLVTSKPRPKSPPPAR